MGKKSNTNQTEMAGTAAVNTRASTAMSPLEAKARAEMAAAKGKLKTAKLLDKFIGVIGTLDEWGCAQVVDAAESRIEAINLDWELARSIE